MKKISCLFLDIGGVLLSNGWGHECRKLAAEHFHLDYKEIEARHKLMYIPYEQGSISLEEYLGRVVFYNTRDFTSTDFLDFIYNLNTPYLDMIDFIKKIKLQYGLKVIAVSNEAREINAYRIKKFKLNEIFDFFVSSCYVHLRKPDRAIFQLAIDGSQIPIDEIIYIDDLQLYVDIANDMGIQSICHKNYESTVQALADLGLSLPQKLIENQ